MKDLVYLMRRKSDGMLKIGSSAYPKRRRSELKRKYGPMEILYTLPGHIEKEREMQRMFQDYQVLTQSIHDIHNAKSIQFTHKTDWFQPHPEIAKWFRDNADEWDESYPGGW